MKTRAAVAARKPLEIVILDLDCPRAGEVKAFDLLHSGGSIRGVVVY